MDTDKITLLSTEVLALTWRIFFFFYYECHEKISDRSAIVCHSLASCYESFMWHLRIESWLEWLSDTLIILPCLYT